MKVSLLEWKFYWMHIFTQVVKRECISQFREEIQIFEGLVSLRKYLEEIPKMLSPESD
jgi:hypothetical protein